MGVEGVEECAQRDADAPPLAEAVLAAERNPLRLSQDERGVGAVQISLSCAGMILSDFKYSRRIMISQLFTNKICRKKIFL